MQRSTRKTTLLLTGLTLALTATCALCPLSNNLILRPLLAPFDSRYVGPDTAPLPFDRDLWKAGNARRRVNMAHYLADNKLLEGKTRAELVEMLGEPDVERPGDEGTRWLLGYRAKGLFDESLWLELTTREEGTAKGAIVGTDWYDPRER